MNTEQKSMEDFLDAILRGAVKILGCNSTSLVLFNEKTQEIRLRVGTMATDYPILAQIERLMGDSFRGITLPLQAARDSMVYRSWKDRTTRETSSLADLVGTAFPQGVIEQMTQLAGEHRYICVPALGHARNYGVLLFEKVGSHPFNKQQREVLLRYARRIGEIVENDLVGQRQTYFSRPGVSLENQLLQLTLGDPAPALFVDPGHHITSCNEATTQLLGYSSAELRQQPISMLFLESRDILDILGQQILNPSTPFSEESAVALCKDGSLYPARFQVLLLADDMDRAVGFLVLIRRPPKAALEESSKQMMEQRLATMGEMAAQLAHEIRNPLVAIGATLESLCQDDLGDEHRAILTSVVREIAKLDISLKDYMVVRPELSFAEVNVRSLLEDTRRLLMGSHRLSGKQVRLDIDPRLDIPADHDALKHVFFNVLINALEASDDTGEVLCRASASVDAVSVTIEDRGQGLSAPAAECLQPFFTTKQNGTGLGLAVCNKIVSAHGGLMELSNRAGGGCRVRVQLPLRYLAGREGTTE